MPSGPRATLFISTPWPLPSGGGASRRSPTRAGALADLVVFDLESLTVRATYDDPHRISEGM